MNDVDREETPAEMAVVLDYLPHGRADDDRPGYQKSPIAYAMTSDDFGLYEIITDSDFSAKIGDPVPLDSSESGIVSVERTKYPDLSSGAKSEVDYVIEDIVDANEERFVQFFNEAQPITLRLHQLNLLPGIGKKLRNAILDQRKRAPFDSFDDMDERVSGLHDPRQVLIERIREEIREDELKYRLFTRRAKNQRD